MQYYIFGHVMPLVLVSASHDNDSIINEMVSLHFLGEDDLNPVKHDLFGHMTTYAPALHDSDRTFYSNTAFIRSTLSN